MEWLKFITLLSFVIMCNSEALTNNYGMNFNYNNTYKYNEIYIVTINKNTEYIMEFSGDLTFFNDPARVTVASDLANKTFPVFITARQQKGVFSWQLPMLVETQNGVDEFNNVSRTLCPHNNVFNEDVESCDISNQNTPIIHLTSSSPVDIKVTISIETVEDFYLQLNNYTNFTSTPSQPKYYFYSFKQNSHFQVDVESQTLKKKYICNENLRTDESAKLSHYMNKLQGVPQGYLQRPKSVIVMIESDDDICAVVSIQNFSCPVFDNERDILYEGYYLTMTRRGGITLTQDSFPLGFYIVFIVKSSDEDCTDQTVTNNITLHKMAAFIGWKDTESIRVTANDGRIKTFSFKIVETISYQEYIIAAGGALGLFLSFYLAAFIAVICQTRRKKTVSDSLTISQSEEGTLTQPVDIIEEEVTPEEEVIRRRVTNTQDVMDSSYASTSRQNLICSNQISDNGNGQNTYTECSSSSDSESEYSTLDDIEREKDVFRLPGRLCLANLARKRPRVLSARSKMYLWNVLTVTVFYTLPVIQLVVTYQRMLNQSGNQDLCYFNFLCAHPLLMLSDFNHVYSNLGYVLLGALFIMQVWRRHRVHMSRTSDEKELGIPQHFGLLYAMGIALVSEGMLSAAYHVCPNSMNFQFDTSFMYVTSVLCMVKIYQSRHPDINARAHATFGVLALIIFIGLVGVLNADFSFWIIFTILHIISCFIMTFQIYYMGRFRFDIGVVVRASKELVSRPLLAITPTYVGRCVLLLLANLANWAIAAYGLIQHNRDFASHLLLILMSNLFLYTMFYIIMKLLHRESIACFTWVFIALTYGFWFGSSYFFLDLSTNWAVTPAQSRKSNQVCSLLQLYDSHDIWHFLSSIAMFFSFNMYLTLDDNLSEISRNNIMVF